MGVVGAWPHLRECCELAAAHPRLQVWLFGSSLSSGTPADLDVLLVYEDRDDVVAVRAAQWWADFEPPLRIIAMTADEERYYGFVAVTGAERLV